MNLNQNPTVLKVMKVRQAERNHELEEYTSLQICHIKLESAFDTYWHLASTMALVSGLGLNLSHF
jgi:hypothetical protein